MRVLVCAIVLVVASALAGCSDPPARPESSNVESFDIVAETIDPSTGAFTVTVRVSPPVSEARVKSLAESLIDQRKNAFGNIRVRTLTSGAGAGDLPYAVSVLQDGVVTHTFNKQAAPQRIPTH